MAPEAADAKAGASAPIRVLIAGSCVSRDTLAVMSAREVELVQYMARQSWLSAVAPPSTLLRPSLPSPFQQRMVDADLASGLLPTLESSATTIDVLLIDLTDERLGVVDLPDGGCATLSAELKTSGALHAAVDEGRLPLRPVACEFGTPEHEERFAAAAKAVAGRLGELGLLERTLVLNTPWARRTEDGDPVRGFLGRSVVSWNTMMARYVAFVRGRGLTVHDMPRRVAVAASDHKWGVAAYHYAPSAYADLRGAIIRFAKERAGQ